MADHDPLQSIIHPCVGQCSDYCVPEGMEHLEFTDDVDVFLVQVLTEVAAHVLSIAVLSITQVRK